VDETCADENQGWQDRVLLRGIAIMKVEFYKHNVSQADIDNAVKVLNSLFLTTGDTVAEFEKKFSEYLGLYRGPTSCPPGPWCRTRR
jgi:hypothetical protein